MGRLVTEGGDRLSRDLAGGLPTARIMETENEYTGARTGSSCVHRELFYSLLYHYSFTAL